MLIKKYIQSWLFISNEYLGKEREGGIYLKLVVGGGGGDLPKSVKQTQL